MKIMWIFFFWLEGGGGEGHLKTGFVLGVVSMHLRVFS